jgi:hypothetical protein
MTGPYMVLAHRSREGREEQLVSSTGKRVNINKATKTGLVDAKGREILRVLNPIGFHW